MSHVTRRVSHAILAVLFVGGLGACESPESPLASAEAGSSVQNALPAAATFNRDLAALRRVTARMHRFETAVAAGWNEPITPCVEHPTEGGMGFHHGNIEYYLNGEANPLEPEVLLYEPGPNGKLRLVGVEYVVPFFAWQGDPDVDDPPRLFGRDMKRNDALEQWDLHVWVWKHNPKGMFEDWNPTVSCEHAS